MPTLKVKETTQEKHKSNFDQFIKKYHKGQSMLSMDKFVKQLLTLEYARTGNTELEEFVDEEFLKKVFIEEI